MKKFVQMKMAFASSIRMLMHDTLFIVCALLSLGMFITFGNNVWTASVMGLVALVFESTKLYSLLKAKKAGKGNRKEKNWLALIFYSTLYTAFAILSLAASVMFALNLLSAKDKIASVSQDTIVLEATDFNDDIDYWKAELDFATEELKTLEAAISRADGNYGTSITKISENKPAIEAKKEMAYDKWQEAKSARTTFQTDLKEIADEQIQVNPTDGFTELANAINSLYGEDVLTPRTLMIIIFIAIMFLLEVSVAVTSGEFPEEEEVKAKESDVKLSPMEQNTKEFFMKYIEAMYFEHNGRLNSDAKISTLIGQSENTCWKIRKSLMTMIFKGKPLMYVEGRKTLTHLSKVNFMKVVNFLLDNPHDGLVIPELP